MKKEQGMIFQLNRYFLISKRSEQIDYNKIYPLILSIILNFVFLYSLLIGVGLPKKYFLAIGLKEIIFYLILDTVLESFLNNSKIRQRIELLTYLKTKYFYLACQMMIVFMIFLMARTNQVQAVIQSQNQLYGFVPGWNIVKLFPLFLVFVKITVFNIKELQVERGEIELVRMQSNILHFLKACTMTSLMVVLFFGSDTSFTWLDTFVNDSIQISLINKFVFIVKYIAIFILLIIFERHTKLLALRTKYNKSRIYLYFTLVVIIAYCSYIIWSGL